ncbi:hypothetical protein KDU71_15365 [Carboxylicivirga sediminis]|uniref:histidine kinase n=1 Tax=Carboxylicivirga sediminis TaxID=2006564 RepID=A0A941F519_9BACT|nr:ATP-binding protein [Carboxylicivirga sediminis]MBR8536951.1 hypothetical protein [Carboxylicivirga sediminis]
MRPQAYFIILLLLFSIQVAGVTKKFRSYHLDDGLSSSTVSCFYKSDNHLVWIGTAKGVDLFTGHEFIPLSHFFTDSAGATNTSITAITEFKDNTLWAGTWGDGLFSVNIENGEYTHYRGAEELSNTTISDNYINCLEVFDDYLWVGTNFGLCQTSGNGHFFHYTFTEVLSRNSADIRAVIQKYEHLLLAFTDNGEIIELNTQSGAYKKVAEINVPLKNITKVTKDHLGRYWIGTAYLGLFILDEHFQPIPIPNQLKKALTSASISDIIYNHEFGIFISSDGGGLIIINPDNLDTQVIKASKNNDALFSNQTESLYLDEDGILWIGYYKDGFSKTYLKDDGIRHISPNDKDQLIPNKNVNCFAKDFNQYIWVGTENGLAILDANLTSITQSQVYRKALRLLKDYPITSLSTNTELSIVYAGTYNNGLYSIDLKKNKIINYNKTNSALESNFVRDLKTYNDTINYVATVDGGVYKFDGTNFEKIKVVYQDKYELLDFLHIEIIDSQNIWLSSTGKGVIRINTSSGTGQMFNAVISTICYSSCLTNDSTIFLATNKGVFEYSNDIQDFIPISDDLSNMDVYGIIEDDEHALWLSSSTGLYRYYRQSKTLEKVTSINIQDREFLPGSFFKLSNDNFLFGGTNGFNAVSPQQYKSNIANTSLFISEFKVYNRSVKPGDTYNGEEPLQQQVNYISKLTIPSHIDLFSVTATTIDYKSADNKKVAYTLKNGKKDSKLFYTDGEIAFLNMKPGRYKLSIYPISGVNNQLIESSAKHLLIQKMSPWWHSVWIYIALFVIITGIILALHLMRVREYKKTQRLLQEKVTERTATLLSQKERLERQKTELQEILAKNKKLESFKENIINMIVHDLKNPLNGIIGLSSLNEAEYFEPINSASRQMLCLVENILDVRRYETHSLQLFYQQCDIRQLANEAIDEVRFLLKDNQIEIINLTNSIIVQVDKDILRRVYINLLTNAIKYSQVNGKIILRGQLKPDASEKTLLLSVQDEGPGISKKFQESIFDLYQQIDTKKSGQANSNGLGLSFCKMAINEHNGKIWVESDVGQGALFNMEIPQQKAKS